MRFAAAGAILHRNMTATGETDRIIPRKWRASEQYGIG
jgi:hypothetical protein